MERGRLRLARRGEGPVAPGVLTLDVPQRAEVMQGAGAALAALARLQDGPAHAAHARGSARLPPQAAGALLRCAA